MQIFIRGGAKLLAVNVENDDTIQDIHGYVAQEARCEMDDVFVTFHGTILNTEQTIEELELVPGAVFDVNMKVSGGKTHGRIGLAGKVKNQTPKVPPQEKSKKKTGRARRREQYAQRFANKVAAPNGIRSGPNANH